MSEPRTVVENLLDSRGALVLEVQRLATAIAELDSVIVSIAGEARRPEPLQIGSGGVSSHGGAAASEPTVTESIERSVDVESDFVAADVSTRAAARKPAVEGVAAPVRKSARGTARPKAAAAQPKSIRVHVLEMLAAEDREFGLAEIIDRIHAEGIAAHDDAVRSITIKLMKDGKIDRPSRGLYRLARRGRAAQNAPTPVPAAPPIVSTPATETGPAVTVTGASTADYTPPLNLGQPWDQRS